MPKKDPTAERSLDTFGEKLLRFKNSTYASVAGGNGVHVILSEEVTRADRDDLLAFIVLAIPSLALRSLGTQDDRGKAGVFPHVL